MARSVSIVQGTNSKPVASRSLVDFFRSLSSAGGHLFIGYPVIGTSEGRYPIDALWISPDSGVVVFDLIEGSNPGDFGGRQDDAANKLEARLKTHRELMQRRNLAVPIGTLSFAPGIRDAGSFVQSDYRLVNLASLPSALQEFDWPGVTEELFSAALSALQSISTIRKSRIRRIVERSDSRGAKLKGLEDSIATLDSLQSQAVIETADGVQRIRGLAGSGKTIVLALKAAYLHAQHPDWRIAVTFNTRSLKGQFRRLINSFSLEQGDEPDWERLRVQSAWGAPGGGERDGIYQEFCLRHGVQYSDFRTAKLEFGSGNEFAGVCERALSSASKFLKLYEAILIDEAQDFPPAFLRMCYEILDSHKRLVYAYDELQNLSGSFLPSPDEIFGKRRDGTPKVSFGETTPNEPRTDIILEKCYRNSRPVLVTAHALGFGIYRRVPRGKTTGLVQMFENADLWLEIGYRLKRGSLTDGQDIILHRTDDSSPRFLEEHSSIDDLLFFKAFDTEEAQADWVAKAIIENLRTDELRHDDIVVINPDPFTTRAQAGPIRRRLLEAGISSHVAGIDTDPDIFFQSEVPSVTFTGIYRAKGNEAGMVYIVNAQDCHSSAWNLATIRNRLFTAITRSKAWVRVLGVGPDMNELIDEYRQLRGKQFELQFRYPTQSERLRLRVVHRDMSPSQRKRLNAKQQTLKQLFEDLEAGVVHPEDLDQDVLAKLEGLLRRKG
jgi:superfamily I DNA and RNA helicase